MNDSYWVMVCDNISEIAEIVMIICIILGVISMAISWLNYCNSNGKKVLNGKCLRKEGHGL